MKALSDRFINDLDIRHKYKINIHTIKTNLCYQHNTDHQNLHFNPKNPHINN